ncbi:DUF488 family protein [Georgenia sp. AZ-5]|uniref:DUF488 domain-containing protein n=1 Tax=Georgenia sp. AZ-5 TaxID=3367526 RepID=UPI003754A2D7
MAYEGESGLHGWGYEGRNVDDLIAYAAKIGAHNVVDIRLNPVSRKRGFSKRALSEHLGRAGFGYVHLRALGNPVDNRPGFSSPGTPLATAAHRRFKNDVLATDEAAKALEKVRSLLEHGAVVLVCFEADQRCCHRSLVIDALTSIRARVAS